MKNKIPQVMTLTLQSPAPRSVTVRGRAIHSICQTTGGCLVQVEGGQIYNCLTPFDEVNKWWVALIDQNSMEANRG